MHRGAWWATYSPSGHRVGHETLGASRMVLSYIFNLNTLGQPFKEGLLVLLVWFVWCAVSLECQCRTAPR